jgi:hypothetical protein
MIVDSHFFIVPNIVYSLLEMRVIIVDDLTLSAELGKLEGMQFVRLAESKRTEHILREF